MKMYALKTGLTRQGFTLIELMVSLSVFSIVMVISIGTLLTLIDSNAKAQALYSSATNLSFALDSITREIRTGYHYYCIDQKTSDELPRKGDTHDCEQQSVSTGGSDNLYARNTQLSFIRGKDGGQVGYRLKDKKIQQKIEDTPGNSNGWFDITSDDVEIKTFDITVVNSETYDDNETDLEQPILKLFIEGSVNNGLETDTDFSIQTKIIQRRLDIL